MKDVSIIYALILFSRSSHVGVQDGWHFTTLFEPDSFCVASQLSPSCRGWVCLRSATRQMILSNNVARNVLQPCYFCLNLLRIHSIP